MTSPGANKVLPSEVTPGLVLFRSWLMLFALFPFDRHSLALESLEVGCGFVEESTSWLQRRWRHERTLTQLPDGSCMVADNLVIEPRVGLARPFVAMVVKKLFLHRHRRLVERFGRGTAESVVVRPGGA